MQMTLSAIADRLQGTLAGPAEKLISGAASFEDASPHEITYAAGPRYLKKIDQTNAGAVLVPRAFRSNLKNLVQVDNPQAAFTELLNIFHPPRPRSYGIHDRAVIGKAFRHGDKISIAPGVVIEDHVAVGDRVTLHPNVVIGSHVTLGDDVIIYPNVTVLEGCSIGSRVIIHAGSVIGSDGFGFTPLGDGYVKIPHLGTVQIDDDVEIGAGNTIDRGTFGKTWIESGVKTDNLVHIAHNVRVGKNTLLVAQVGISGSTSIGSHAVLAGQAGVSGHLKIGKNVTIGPQAGIAKSVPDGSVVSGTPEMPHRTWLRVHRILPRLPELKKKILALEKQLRKIEKK